MLSLYTYFSPRQRIEYYEMYYTSKLFNETIHSDKSKNNITKEKIYI